MFNDKIFTIYKNTDKEFKGTLEEISNKFDISEYGLLVRMFGYNNTIEESLSILLNKKYLDKKEKEKLLRLKYTFLKDSELQFYGTLLEASKYYNCKYGYILDKINYYEIEDCFNSFNIYIVFKDEENQFIGYCIDIAKHFDLDKKRLRGYIKRYGKKNKDVTEAVLKCNK